MSFRMPQVREFMTPAPRSVAAATPLGEIQKILRELGVRHLPVEDGQRIVGIVSDRSVKAAQGKALTARDLLIPDPYTVLAANPLDEVAAVMAEEKYGCVLVEDDEKALIGIFTTVDACRALRQVLETCCSS